MSERQLLVGTEAGLYMFPTEEGVVPPSPLPVAFEKLDVDPVGLDAGAPTILYALVGQQGLWRSDDRGGRWTLLWEAPKGTKLYTFVTHPTKPGVLYAGLEPAAVWRSDNGGRTWRELEALQAVPDKGQWRFFHPRQAHVRALAVRLGTPEILYVGIEEGGVYASDDEGKTFHSLNEGIYRDIHQIRPFPTEPDLLLATTGDGLYRSTDRGGHWSHIQSGLTRSYTVPLLIESAPPHTMLVAAAAAPPPSWDRGDRGADAKIFRSRDRGLTWQEIATGLSAPQKGMVYCLLAHPHHASQLFAGTTDGKIVVSMDHGDHWNLSAGGLPEVYSLAWVP